MNRAETKARARDLWQEVCGSPTWGDELGVDAELDAVADELARRKWCFFGLRTVSLTAGQRSLSFSSAKVLRLSGAFWNGVELEVRNFVRELRQNATFRTMATGTAPVYVVSDGSTLWLCPGVTSAVSGSLELLGFLSPKGLWDEETNENPLPVWAHEATALGLAARRAALFPELASQAMVLRERYEAAGRELEPLAHEAYRAAMGG